MNPDHGNLATGARACDPSGGQVVPGPRLLLAEDDPTVASVVSAYLRHEGFTVDCADDGHAALRLWRDTAPSLVVLDVMLPGLSGLNVLTQRRGHGDHTPVLILSALGEEEDRIVGFETGADDYLGKPFSPRELVLRVRALLGREERLRSSGILPRRVHVGALVVDIAAHTVERDGEPVDLTVREFDLLAFLATHPDEAFTKEHLLRRVWGWDVGDTSTVVVHVRRLRRKVERDAAFPEVVQTVRGVGYRLTGVRP
ncbi:MAG: response regulator transcription factor [Janthinobacterium lividum]